MIRSVVAAVASPAKRERILDAAELLFSRNGFRAVRMETIAAEAGVAKATLYSYFPNRDAVFAAAADRLAERLVGGVREESQRSGPVDQRIAGALLWKHQTVFELTHGGHSRELLGAKDRLARKRFERADADMVAALAAALRDDAILAPAATPLARALFFGTQGLSENAPPSVDLETEIETFVLMLLRGARTRPATRRRIARKGGTR